ncbi:hypothetical protein H4R34_003314 [Dimargaris verticillata]|uniref:DUF7905 domain-containing protein n=1 Tax=Dimargaris verticillata TaxID=2761393 RepID=A0A9W8B2E8_9FUNG|nr:hypothetical protein H4R34_003314 [Dimargaris verticillata]
MHSNFHHDPRFNPYGQSNGQSSNGSALQAIFATTDPAQAQPGQGAPQMADPWESLGNFHPLYVGTPATSVASFGQQLPAVAALHNAPATSSAKFIPQFGSAPAHASSGILTTPTTHPPALPMTMEPVNGLASVANGSRSHSLVATRLTRRFKPAKRPNEDETRQTNVPPWKRKLLVRAQSQSRADGIWVVPENCRPTDIFGRKYWFLLELNSTAMVHSRYDHQKNRVDIWGTKQCVEHLQRELTMKYQALKEQGMLSPAVPTAKARSKPLRRLGSTQTTGLRTSTAIPNLPGRQHVEAVAAMQSIYGIPTAAHSIQPSVTVPSITSHGYYEAIPLPVPAHERSTYADFVLGENRNAFEQISAGNQCTLSYDDAAGVVQVVCDNSRQFQSIVERVRTLVNAPQQTAKLAAHRIRLIDPSATPCMLRFQPTVTSFAPKTGSPHSTLRYLTPIPDNPAGVISYNHIANAVTTDAYQQTHQALCAALGKLQAYRGYLRLGVTFGTIGYAGCPKDVNYPLEAIYQQILPQPRLQSVFNPTVTRNDGAINGLLVKLTAVAELKPPHPKLTYYLHCTRTSTSTSMAALTPNTKFTIFAMFETKLDAAPTTGSAMATDWLLKTCLAYAPLQSFVQVQCNDVQHAVGWQMELMGRHKLGIAADSDSGKLTGSVKMHQGQLQFMIPTGLDVDVVTCERQYRYIWDEQYVIEVTAVREWHLGQLQPQPLQVIGGRMVCLPGEPNHVSYQVSLRASKWTGLVHRHRQLQAGKVLKYDPGQEIQLEALVDYWKHIRSLGAMLHNLEQ